MKTKLEAIANVTVIVAALAMGYVVLSRYVAAYRVPRSLEPGDRLSVMPNINWSQHRHTLVLALNTGCHFCEQSVPFYRRLADARALSGSELEIVAVFPNEQEMVRQFMTKGDLRLRSVAELPLEKLGVNATPTLILVDNQGRVECSWIGALTPPGEQELFKSVFRSGTTIQSKQKMEVDNENVAFASEYRGAVYLGDGSARTGPIAPGKKKGLHGL